MKHLILIISILFLGAKSTNAQLFRSDVVDNTLVNQYSAELLALKKKYSLPTAFGFSKSITNRDGSMHETIVVWYRTETGEVEDKIVSARILHYKEVATPTQQITTTVSPSDKNIVIRDTVTIIKRDTVLMEETISTDSLSFKAKRVAKNKSGYIITGNVRDKDKEIPVVLSTYVDEVYVVNGVDRRFTNQGRPVYMNNRPVATVFSPIQKDGPYLVKLMVKNPTNWNALQNDACYISEYVVPALFWNSERNNLSWDKQVEFMKLNYPKID